MVQKNHKEFLEELQIKNPLIFKQLDFIEDYGETNCFTSLLWEEVNKEKSHE